MRSSSLVPMPGMCRTASFLSLIQSAAAANSCSSGTLEKPYWNDEPPSPSPCDTSITGTPASTSPLTIARTCSGVNWCAIAWLPSRSVVSHTRGATIGSLLAIARYPSAQTRPRLARQSSRPLRATRTRRPRRLARGHQLAPLAEQVLGELLADLHRRGGHDVQVARVGRQVVARPGDLDEHRDLVAVEQRLGTQPVAGHVLLHALDHLLDGAGDRRLVRVVDHGVHRVAHEDGWLGRVEHDDRLALLRAAHFH